MKLLRPRVVSVAAAGLGVALVAVGATHALAASATSARPRALGCQIILDCIPAIAGEVRAVVPPGLVDRGTEQSLVPAVGGGKQQIKKKDYASDDKPWQGPGDLKVGRKISVRVIHSDKPEDVPVTSLPDGVEKLRDSLPDNVKAQAGTLPGNIVTISIGGHKAFITEQTYPLKRVRDKKTEQVPVSSVGIVLSPTDHILITGEGITVAQLQLVATTVEVL
jgi:hypothetical protein